ncbi:universal stress protein [Mucilaginibacter psychrotolerans]|uniref:Universal stress protein n=1 Tax=Mucilaginibacter psychrotolerans TaxID=1524096 RepID=A0A4Y8S8S3_9SPHI|nr:universal stress protein [Mucilaginibacter psychrotolerans]TFF35398.1 universal stress protein [Mucilaginibacter psychrotolerans]
MKTILVISDNSAGAENALLLGNLIARHEQCEILIAQVHQPVTKTVVVREFALVAGNSAPALEEPLVVPDAADDPLQRAVFLDIAGKKESEIAAEINSRNIWMVIKGCSATQAEVPGNIINTNYVLNRIKCPMILVPENWEVKDLERIVYVADLRYCRLEIVKFLAGLAALFNATVSVNHLSARGLPHMDEAYALSIFTNEIYNRVHYPRLLFNNTSERDMGKAVDVMINGLHNDLLAVVNHRFHFEEIFGQYIGESLPGRITVPLIIFPY